MLVAPTMHGCGHRRRSVESGRFGRVVRYNMRGTGGSSGFKTLSASTDGADAAELCMHLTRQASAGGVAGCDGHAGQQQLEQQHQQSKHGKSIVLLAYSYGSCVAAEALSRCKLVSHGSICMDAPA